MFHPGCFDAGHSLSNTEQWTNWELRGEDPAVVGQGPVNHLRVLQAIDTTIKTYEHNIHNENYLYEHKSKLAAR